MVTAFTISAASYGFLLKTRTSIKPMLHIGCTSRFRFKSLMVSDSLRVPPGTALPEVSTISILLTTRAVVHRSVEEIWDVLSGSGEIWRRHQAREEVVRLVPGVCVTIPLGTEFQFRSSTSEGVEIIAITMPPWPGEGEAVFVNGVWEPMV